MKLNLKLKKYLKKLFLKILLLIILFLIYISTFLINMSNKKRIGIINVFHMQNVGNILVKFALFKKLKEFNLSPIIISLNDIFNSKINIDFIKRTVKLKKIKESYSELNEKDYDYLVVNSDQTWYNFSKKYFYDTAFLKFAENWKTPKFIYAASTGRDYWIYSREDDKIASKLLQNFTGISFREKGLVKLAEKHLQLNIKPIFVLDPTFLIDKNYYLKEITNYKRNFNFSEKYIFIYQLDNNNLLEKFANESSSKLSYKIYRHNLTKDDYIESFLFGINNSHAIITDSFHGTVFSIIFNKPFISFINRKRGKGRFDSLIEVFNLGNRIIDTNISYPNINLLLEPLNINGTLLNELKTLSINYLKKNLGILN